MFFGRVLRIVSSKYLFLLCVVIFEAGSLICALAPNMDVLIFGRAVQGKHTFPYTIRVLKHKANS